MPNGAVWWAGHRGPSSAAGSTPWGHFTAAPELEDRPPSWGPGLDPTSTMALPTPSCSGPPRLYPVPLPHPSFLPSLCASCRTSASNPPPTPQVRRPRPTALIAGWRQLGGKRGSREEPGTGSTGGTSFRCCCCHLSWGEQGEGGPGVADTHTGPVRLDYSTEATNERPQPRPGQSDTRIGSCPP